MDISSVHPQIDPSSIPLDSLAGNGQISDQQKVAEVSRQFEAVLLRQIFQEIRKPTLAAEQGDPAINAIYNDMVNNQLADSVSRSGGFGLAKSLAAQLSHQVLAHSATQTKLGQISHPTASPRKKLSP